MDKLSKKKTKNDRSDKFVDKDGKGTKIYDEKGKQVWPEKGGEKGGEKGSKKAGADREALIRLASSLPVGSAERRAILAGLSKGDED